MRPSRCTSGYRSQDDFLLGMSSAFVLLVLIIRAATSSVAHMIQNLPFVRSISSFYRITELTGTANASAEPREAAYLG
jgi:hypothetical protein